ncbi:hypothetical protein JOD24_002252 [Kroppenstedtia sanguinis]
MNFDDYYCAVMFLTAEQKSNKREFFVKYKDKLFLKSKTFLHDNGVSKLGYLYETDDGYRKTLFGKERGGIIEQTFGTTDVNTHFREMVEFGKYDSILPLSSNK